MSGQHPASGQDCKTHLCHGCSGCPIECTTNVNKAFPLPLAAQASNLAGVGTVSEQAIATAQVLKGELQGCDDGPRHAARPKEYARVWPLVWPSFKVSEFVCNFSLQSRQVPSSKSD